MLITRKHELSGAPRFGKRLESQLIEHILGKAFKHQLEDVHHPSDTFDTKDERTKAHRDWEEECKASLEQRKNTTRSEKEGPDPPHSFQRNVVINTSLRVFEKKQKC